MLVSLFAVMVVDVCRKFRRRCSCKVCFTVVDGAVSHAGSHRSAAPIAGGVAAKVGVGTSPGRSTLPTYVYSVFFINSTNNTNKQLDRNSLGYAPS